MPRGGLAATARMRERILADELITILARRKEMFAAAESCTAGLAADIIASVSGASKVFWGSFVTYTVDAKIKMLGMPETFLKEHGAVSRPVALAMAEGALEKSGASWAFSITGLAGPDGDGSGVPVGTVWIGIAGHDSSGSLCSEADVFLFSGNRNKVRKAAAIAALRKLLEKINQE